MTYRNTVDGAINVVLQKGHVVPGQPVLTRMHAISIFDDVLGRPGAKKRVLQRSMEVIGREGAGLIVLLLPNKPQSLVEEVSGISPNTSELREYGIGAQILADLGVSEMILLTNSTHNVVGLEGYGITVVEERRIPE